MDQLTSQNFTLKSQKDGFSGHEVGLVRTKLGRAFSEQGVKCLRPTTTSDLARNCKNKIQDEQETP